MCGIAGLAHVADPVRTETMLTAMAQSMEHRGPDDEGVEIVCRSPVVGLAARRLAVQDVSPHGHQPMQSPRSSSWIAFNGEIYNAPDLRADLWDRGHQLRGHSDTEVVLAAFDEWGPDCLTRLRGMFALAVWDAGAEELFLARDRLGIKPLYYYHEDGRLSFASEVRTLTGPGGVPAEVCSSGLASYLALGGVQDPRTMIRGVRNVEAGGWVRWRKGRLSTGTYWSLDHDAFAGPAVSSREEAVRELRTRLEDVVERHLISDVPVGVFLSGGIDSTALVGLVSEVSSAPRTVSVVFPQPEYSEAEHIAQISNYYDTEHSEINLDESNMLSEVPAALAAMDSPTFDGVNTFIVSRAAREAGLTVALSGLGSDELFGGYASFRNVPRMVRAQKLLPAPASQAAGALVARGSRVDGHQKLARWLRQDRVDSGAYALHRELFGGDVLAALTPATRGRNRAWSPAAKSGGSVNDVSRSELAVYMRNVLLRDSDAMSMAHGLELRVPFLDHELVRFVASLPGGWKLGRSPKTLLTTALADLLPREIVHRRKMGFTLPFDNWMRGPLRSQVDAVLRDPALGGRLADELDPHGVEDVWHRFLAGKTGWTRPWALYVVKVWGESNVPG